MKIASRKRVERFSTRVHETFLAIAQREPKRVALVDARPPIETVHQEIVRVVSERLKS